MGIALIPQTFISRQFDVIAGDDVRRHAAVFGQVLRKAAPQFLINLVGCCIDKLKAKAARHPAIKKGTGQRACARTCVQKSASLQGTRREHGRHEASYGRRCHKLTKRCLALRRREGRYCVTHVLCDFWL